MSRSQTVRKRFPIAFCPQCGHTILYSGNPKDRNTVALVPASENDAGKSVLCAKCKTMLAIREKAAGKTVLIPVTGFLIS